MKIAIPIEEKSLQSDICTFFGRTPYFLIYDSETKTSEFIENTGRNAQGGAGIKAAQSIIDKNVKALIVTQLGENAIEVLKIANMQIYKANSFSAKTNIQDLLNNKLEKMEY